MLVLAFHDLADRRVPHYMAAYIAGSWGLIEFVSFLEERFLFSPHWTNLTLLVLALLIPSVFLFAYNHGRPGKDGWAPSEKVGIPANFLVLLVIVFATFGGKDLGAVTTTVTVEDEEGNEVERIVPKSEFRKRLALFHFGPPGGPESSTLWYALGTALQVDLIQDMFLDVRPPILFREDMREAGYDDPRAAPFSLRRQLAQKAHMDYVVDGDVEQAGDSVLATLRIYDVERGKLLQESSVRAGDVFEAADSLSVAVRRGLGVPQGHIDASPDLAAREMLTASPEAFDHFVRGNLIIERQDDWTAAVAELEKAVQVDPTFAEAHFNLYIGYLFSQRMQEAVGAIDAAKEHLYKLPERRQFDVRYSYYYARQNVDAAYRVLETKAELYPEDIQAHQQLALMKQLKGDKEGAIESLERVLELAPAQTEHLQTIASLHRSLGDFESALAYLERFAEAEPDHADAYSGLGDLHRLLGNHDEARAQYEKALTLDDDPGLLGRIALLDRNLGDFDAALRRLEERLASSTTPQVRIGAHGALADHYAYRGQLGKAIEHWEARLAEAAPIAPPLFVLDLQSELIGPYAESGRVDEARQLLGSLAAQLQPPLDVIAAFGELDLALALEDGETAADAAERAERAFDTFPMETERPEFLGMLGRIAELQGDCAAAIREWGAQVELDPTDATVHERIGRCHRELGDLAAAEAAIRRTLAVIPSHPRANYELALVYEAKGDRAGAIRHLRTALEAWAPADSGNAEARKAREKLAALEGGATTAP